MGSIPKVLVVDDDGPSRTLMADILRSHGCEVVVGENGNEAVVLAAVHRPDLILLDIRMPVVTGIEAARMLKEQPATTGIPIVAVTSSAMPGDEARILEAGCDGYLPKPTTPSEIVGMVNRFIRLPPRRASGAGTDPDRGGAARR